jgi:nicotinate-nucleotide adenylyltransferase
MTSGARIGLFGGTFNPIHLGHLRAAEEVREALSLERVFFMPSRNPPHKKPDPNDPIASAEQRLRWVEQSISGHDHFSIDRIELDREGPSFLVDTLTTIHDREPDHARPVFIVGQDAFAEMGDWREPEALFALSDFAVMTRPPGQLVDLADRIPKVVRPLFEFMDGGRRARHKQAGTSIDLVPITALDISSSHIRQQCRAARSIRFLVAEPVRASIEDSGCYASQTVPRPQRAESGRR